MERLSFFMTLISPKIPTLITSNMTRSISITSIQPNVKQSSTLKKPTFRDLPRLAEALQLPPTFHCQQRTVFDSMEGLCMFLKRVCYPCRYSDHRSTGNFLPGGGGAGAVNHLPKKISQVAQIFAKESKRNEGHIAKT